MSAPRKFNYAKMDCGNLFYGCLDAKDMDLVETARWLEACAASGWCGWAYQGDAFQGSTNELATWVSSLADTIMFRALKAKPHDPAMPEFNAQRFESRKAAFDAWWEEEARPKRHTEKKIVHFMDWMASRPVTEGDA